MSDILCKWLNDDVRLSQAVEPKTLAKNFASGYLIGEVLHKYRLQTDFTMFTKKDTTSSRRNNFTRLEPTLHLLGISFDINTVQALIQEKQGVATHLLYQLYIKLEKNKTAQISRTMMEIIQPAAKAGLHKKEHEIYSFRLHKVVKRNAEMKLQKISKYNEDKCQQFSTRSAAIPPITIHPQQRRLKVQDVQKININEKLGIHRWKNSDSSCTQATITQVPKPPPYTSQLSQKTRQRQHQQRAQAQKVQTEIAEFEANRKKMATYSSASSSCGQPFSRDFPLGTGNQDTDCPESAARLILQPSGKYIQDIRQKLAENAVAREQREKRQYRFIMEQLKAREAQEESQREEQLVWRLTRPTQQEQRLAAQLLQIRRQKEVILENRLFRELQYQQRRERDFQEALEREAALAQQAKLEHSEEIKKELKVCKRIAAERAQSRNKKHSAICKDILEQMVDFATKIGEYPLLTGTVIPEKQMREWKDLLLNGLPLYESTEGQKPGFEFCPTLDPIEFKKQEILNNRDYDEYINMAEEWAWPVESGEAKTPPTNNNILGHIVSQLNIVHQPVVAPSSPPLPHFTLKACVLGKFCSGKTTCLTNIAKALGMYVLSADTLIKEALNAFQNGEKATEQKEANETLPPASTLPKPDLDSQEEAADSNIRPSARAMQGAAIDKELRKGNAIPDKLLVDVIAEAIRQIPAQSCWILDGFPLDITQAHMLEEALGGTIDRDVRTIKTNLVADPNPPKPPAPPPPVLDLAVLLDIPDECVVLRAYNHTVNTDDAATTPHPPDKTLYLAQIKHRIRAFEETWPKLEKWFDEKQNILIRVDADVDEEELYKKVESVLQQAVMQTQEGTLVDQHSEELPRAAGSISKLNKEKSQDMKLHSKSSTSSHRGPLVTNENSEEVPQTPPERTCPPPGSSCWVYVNDHLPPEIAENLCSYWDTMCDSYVKTIKMVMQQLRSQHTLINRHLSNIRENYKHYLSRPDLKQELVTQWQRDFNNIPDDMREDEETKAELHLRLDELCERLWDISDRRKKEDERERDAVMSDTWLEDHHAIFINHHSILLQAELDRFKTTLCILKIYYLSMYNQVLPEMPSDIVQLSLLDPHGLKDQSERFSDSSEKVFSKNQDQPCVKKLVSDYDEALAAINNLVSAEPSKGGTEEQKEGEIAPDKETVKVNESSQKKTKGKQSLAKPKAAPTPTQLSNEKSLETIHGQEVKTKVYREYRAAQEHEENAAKLRIALVKSHGLMMVKSLNGKVEQTSLPMQKWLEEHYHAEMKSIDQLSEVVRHHIESGAKLIHKVMLDGTDFYMKEDCRTVRSPPPRPPTVEKTSGSTLTITQLESLRQQLYIVAPSGFMSSSEFFSLLGRIVSVNLGGNTLPEPWFNVGEAQLMEIVSLLTDDCGLIDWRRFLLSAALPWPFPSLTQLLLVLERFRAVDTDHHGYINETQYLQTELWFPSECDQPVPEDPTEPLPYDRLDNLHKFFFKLLADHSISPPLMDYVCMLQYLAAHPNPRQGFIRALSIELGQHLKLSSPSHFVKSLPSIDEATELSFSEPVEADTEVETPSNTSLGGPGVHVSIPALLAVICHRLAKLKDDGSLPSGCLSQEEHNKYLVHIFRELDHRPEDSIPFSVLSQHPFIPGLMENSTQHQLVDIHRVLLTHQDEEEASS